MTQDEIKTMAFQAGFYDGREDLFWVGSDGLARFAALVAAKERGRFALECIDLVALHGGSVEIEAAIRARGQKEAA